jgi:hypothetical protein
LHVILIASHPCAALVGGDPLRPADVSHDAVDTIAAP